MGLKSRRKGYRGEADLVRQLIALGEEAERVALAKGTGRTIGYDLLVNGEKAECKWRKNGWGMLYRYLEGKDVLFLKADRKPFLVVWRLE